MGGKKSKKNAAKRKRRRNAQMKPQGQSPEMGKLDSSESAADSEDDASTIKQNEHSGDGDDPQTTSRDWYQFSLSRLSHADSDTMTDDDIGGKTQEVLDNYLMELFSSTVTQLKPQEGEQDDMESVRPKVLIREVKAIAETFTPELLADGKWTKFLPRHELRRRFNKEFMQHTSPAKWPDICTALEQLKMFDADCSNVLRLYSRVSYEMMAEGKDPKAYCDQARKRWIQAICNYSFCMEWNEAQVATVMQLVSNWLYTSSSLYDTLISPTVGRIGGQISTKLSGPTTQHILTFPIALIEDDYWTKFLPDLGFQVRSNVSIMAHLSSEAWDDYWTILEGQFDADCLGILRAYGDVIKGLQQEEKDPEIYITVTLARMKEAFVQICRASGCDKEEMTQRGRLVHEWLLSRSIRISSKARASAYQASGNDEKHGLLKKLRNSDFDHSVGMIVGFITAEAFQRQQLRPIDPYAGNVISQEECFVAIRQYVPFIRDHLRRKGFSTSEKHIIIFRVADWFSEACARAPHSCWRKGTRDMNMQSESPDHSSQDSTRNRENLQKPLPNTSTPGWMVRLQRSMDTFITHWEHRLLAAHDQLLMLAVQQIQANICAELSKNLRLYKKPGVEQQNRPDSKK